MPAKAPHRVCCSASTIVDRRMLQYFRDPEGLKEHVRAHLVKELGQFAYDAAEIVMRDEADGQRRYTARINILTDEQLQRIIEWHANMAVDRHTRVMQKAAEGGRPATEGGSDVS